MDPNATLAALRTLVERDQNGLGCVDADEFAELFAALDEWITKGGFLPADWAKGVPSDG